MENKKINIAQILKEQKVPNGTVFYCPLCGKCELISVEYDNISLKSPKDLYISLSRFGRFYREIEEDGECMLYPSENERDWNNYKYESKVDFTKIVSDYYYNKQHLLSPYFFDLTPKLQCIIKMMAVADHLNEGWEPDWNDRLQYKYCIEMDLHEGEWRFITFFVTDRRFNTCYFKTAELAEKAIELLGESCLRVALS